MKRKKALLSCLLKTYKHSLLVAAPKFTRNCGEFYAVTNAASRSIEDWPTFAFCFFFCFASDVGIVYVVRNKLWVECDLIFIVGNIREEKISSRIHIWINKTYNKSQKNRKKNKRKGAYPRRIVYNIQPFFWANAISARDAQPRPVANDPHEPTP